jgi:hypothetical protein
VDSYAETWDALSNKVFNLLLVVAVLTAALMAACARRMPRLSWRWARYVSEDTLK